jgi:hypothetical protein
MGMLNGWIGWKKIIPMNCLEVYGIQPTSSY